MGFDGFPSRSEDLKTLYELENPSSEESNSKEGDPEKTELKSIKENIDTKENSIKVWNLFYNEDIATSGSRGRNDSGEEMSKNFESKDFQESLSEIMSDFSTEVNFDTLDEFFDLPLEDKMQLNNDLNLAFEKNVDILLKGKNKENYDFDKVTELLYGIKDGDPYDKISYFIEIKKLVNNGIGSKGKKQIDTFKKGKESDKRGKESDKELGYLKKLANKEEGNKYLLQDALTDLQDIESPVEVSSGDIFPGYKEDKVNEGADSSQEQV